MRCYRRLRFGTMRAIIISFAGLSACASGGQDSQSRSVYVFEVKTPTGSQSAYAASEAGCNLLRGTAGAIEGSLGAAGSPSSKSVTVLTICYPATLSHGGLWWATEYSSVELTGWLVSSRQVCEGLRSGLGRALETRMAQCFPATLAPK